MDLLEDPDRDDSETVASSWLHEDLRAGRDETQEIAALE